MSLKLILDPSQENACPETFVAVASETDFLQRDGSEQLLFVRGEFLCRWVRDLCRARGFQEGIDYQELSSPREWLRRLIGENADEVQPETVNRAVECLMREPNLTLGQLLRELTGSDFWVAAPSKECCARWLLADVATEMGPLVEAMKREWAKGCADELLKRLYELSITERQQALKEWLSAEDDSTGLGVFPIVIEGEAANTLKDVWGQKLRQSNGQTLEKLSTKNPNARLIAVEAYKYFRYHWEHLTAGTIVSIGSLLTPSQRSHLERLIPRDCPEPLSPDASEQEALRWATQQYLPYREWQVNTALTEEAGTAEELGGSFADWLLENYPRLTTKSYEESLLNVRGKYVVAELVKEYRVLWVVVDGLNYLNHRRLLRLLAKTDAALCVEQDYDLLAVLPTITEKAKYGLTSGLLPRQNLKGIWETQKVLSDSFPQALYAGKARLDKLKVYLADENVRLCYWNMTAVDECYHEQTDPDAIHHNVEAQLSALAGSISQLVAGVAAPDRVAVVISTDHGQMLGPCFRHEDKLKDADVHGRTAKGNPFALKIETDQAYLRALDGSVVVLNPIRFQLSEPTTLALKSYHFGGWSKDSKDRAWGVHGGLFPEEVVVGFSVLLRKHQPKPIKASVTGTGKTGNPGKLTLWVDNPNSAPIRLLTLTLIEADEYRQPRPLQRDVAGLSQAPVELELQKFPAPVSGDNLIVTGTLTYEFSDGVRHECAITGTLTCKQMYGGQRPSLRDRFKK